MPRRIYDLAWQQVETDAEFIANARGDVPALLDEIERLRTTLQECQRGLRELLRRREPAAAQDLARIEQYLAQEDSRWEDTQEKVVKGRRLHMTVPTIRPREPATIITMSRPVRSDLEG